MEKLKARLNRQDGFTLIEMLIVVAIIAILIAIAIPMINSSLERAREATDEANMRGAIGLAYVELMMEDGILEIPDDELKPKRAYYRVENDKGSLVDLMDPDFDGVLTPYGKGTAIGSDPESHVGQVVVVLVHSNGDVTAKWETPKTF